METGGNSMLLTSKKFIAKLAALLLIINSLSFSQEHSSLISHWQIVPDEIVNGQLKDVNDKNNASFKGRLYKLSANSKNVVVLDGSENHFLITDDINKASLPQKEFSVSVIVNIKQYNNYSGIISAFQDNGSFEKGWRRIAAGQACQGHSGG